MKTITAAFAFACFGATACGSDDPGPPCDPTVPGTLCTIVGSGDNGYEGDGDLAYRAKLSLPQDTLGAADGTLFVVDWNNHRIRRLTLEGNIEHVAGRGELGGGLDDPASDDFNHLTNIIHACDGSNALIISAWHNSMIRTLDLDSGDIVDTCGDGRRAYFGDGGAALDAALDLPSSVACTPDGEVMIMDQANMSLRKLDEEGLIQRVAGTCVVDWDPPEGPGPCENPIQCPGNSGKFTCGDPESTCGTPCRPGYNGDEVAALDARLAQPFGQSADPGGRLAYDADGNLYFADTSNQLIRMLDTDGIIHNIAGTPGESGYDGDGGPATAALLNNPVDLAFGPDGTLYFTDVYNHCVRAVDSDGTISTVVGQCGNRGYEGDGEDPLLATLNLPFGVHVHDGTMYVADSGNNVIRSLILP